MEERQLVLDKTSSGYIIISMVATMVILCIFAACFFFLHHTSIDEDSDKSHEREK